MTDTPKRRPIDFAPARLASERTNHVIPFFDGAVGSTEPRANSEEHAMSYVTVPPYIVTDEDGSRPRVRIAVSTPAAVVFVDSSARDRFVVNNQDRSGANIAIQVARSYVRKHRDALERLYLALAPATVAS